MKPWDEDIDPQTYAIIGAAYEVHNELGPGFLEAAYHRALKLELADRAIPFESEVQLPLNYKGRPLGVPWRADLICHSNIVVELKALPVTGRNERAQLRHYLKATGYDRGLLLNFGAERLGKERVTQNPTFPHPGPPRTEDSIPGIPVSQASQTPGA